MGVEMMQNVRIVTFFVEVLDVAMKMSIGTSAASTNCPVRPGP